MYSFTSHVRYSEVDENWRLTIPALIDYLQDCSTFQSDLLGMGPEHIASTKLRGCSAPGRSRFASCRASTTKSS